MPRRCAVLDLDHRHTCPEQARPEAESAMKRKPAGHDRYELHPQLAADTHPLASFALSDLRLMDDSNYPWLVLVPRVAGASELVDLDPMQRRALGDDLDHASDRKSTRLNSSHKRADLSQN